MGTVPRSRPNFWQRLYYAFGGRLPEHLRDWVRHDLTDADWRWRAVLRVLAQCVTPVVIIMVLPGPWTVRVFTSGLLVVGAVFVTAAYTEELRERRLRQHGLDTSLDTGLDGDAD